MLMVTPATLARLRAETRAPVSLAPIRVSPIKKLARHRREAIVEKLVVMMRAAEPTPFAVEAPARVGVRSALCLQGWRWAHADVAAAEVVASALNRVGAVRPTWEQGQPEHTQQAVLPILRERCSRCGKKMPEDAHGLEKYCGPVCASAAKEDLRQRRYEEFGRVKNAASLAARAAKQATRKCQSCGRYFQPKWEDNRFCSLKCFHDDRRFARRNMQVVRDSIFCEGC